MTDNRLDNSSLLVDESIYATGNGYIGVRGNFEEEYPEGYETIRGTFLNGFYDTHTIKYSESAYGFPTTGETIVNVIDAQGITLDFDGEIFNVSNGIMLEIKRSLNVKEGYATRTIKWQNSKGQMIELVFKRMNSFVVQELFLLDIEIHALDYEGTITIHSTLKLADELVQKTDDPRVAVDHIPPLKLMKNNTYKNYIQMIAQTGNSHKKMQVVCSHSIDMAYTKSVMGLKGMAQRTLKKGDVFRFQKYAIYTDEHKHKSFETFGINLLEKMVGDTILNQYKKQKRYLDLFWEKSTVKITGDDAVEAAIQLNMYQLLSGAGKDGLSQIAAKGLSGAGYEGHYFWDTEIYMLPLFTLTQPDIAKALLTYRYNTLKEAKKRAHTLGHKKGAKIPWRTISGIECSSYFPAGTAQYHINADVAYGVIQYHLVTGDDEFIKEYGFELLLETGRIWLDMGHFDENKFMIDNVTGPDEYTAIVNNNYYTNAMAKYHMAWIVRFYHLFKKDLSECLNRLSVSEEEINLFQKASNLMFLPFDIHLNIHAQDDSFLSKKIWDFKNTKKEQYPLLLNFHPLTIYRHQVLKQADTVLAHFLLDDVSEAILKSTYDYYEKITTHDSSLSPCVYGMMASRINQPEKAYAYLLKTIFLDIKNLHGNTKDGLHIANAGGSYMAIVYGFAGLRMRVDGLSIRPTKPHQWEDYSFKLMYRSIEINITVSNYLTVFTSGPVNIWIDNIQHHIDGLLEVEYNGKH